MILALSLMPQIASADLILAARTLRAKSILTASDMIVQPGIKTGAFTDISELVGLEARVVLYEGRPITRSDVGPAALVERNQVVTLVYENAALLISAEGRALGRAGVGEPVKVMNLTSRNIIGGVVDQFGRVIVGASTVAAYN